MPFVAAIDVLVALMLALAAAAPDRGAPARSPKADSPIAAVHCLARAYSEKSLEDFAALLTADYRFHDDSGGGVLASQFVDGFTREHELKSASGLFNGVVREGRVVMPAAVSIATTLDGLSEGPDPEHQDSTGHYRVVAVRRFRMTLGLANGDTVALNPSLHVFHLVRGDAALCAPGQPADSGRWYLRRWLEDIDGLTLALAEDRGRCGEPAPKPGAPARSEGAGVASEGSAGAPRRLAIHPLGNPACPTLDLTCDLPGSESALLEVFDVMGRMMNHRDLPATAPGTVRIAAGAGARLAPGIYWVRLSQGARRPSTRMVVVAR